MNPPAENSPELSAGLSVVVPVYNSEPTLAQLVARLEPVLQTLSLPHELILVNDGSQDGSWDAIRQLAAAQPWVRGICLMRNYGQHNALLVGVRAARYDRIVTMDDDLQHPPEVLPRLLARLTDGVDVLYGPPEQRQHGLFRNAASFITMLSLKSAVGAETARLVCALRVFRTHLRRAFEDYHGPFVSLDVLLTWGTTRFAAVAVPHEARRYGRSNYTFGQLVRHALNMMTGYSVLPLQLGSFVGFTFTLFGMGVLAYVLVNYLITGSRVAGFAFLASIIAIFSGAQLFALGIIGEYLARIHFRTMDKPTYAIKEHTHGS